MEPKSGRTRPHPAVMALAVLALVAFTLATIHRLRAVYAQPTPGRPAVVAPAVVPVIGQSACGHNAPTQAAPPADWTPPVVSSALAVVVNKRLDEETRLKPLVDGSTTSVNTPRDLAALGAILLDPTEGDTLRNETANMLRNSGSPDLAGNLMKVLVEAREGSRFRSFAAQHLGVLWEDSRKDGKPGDAQIRDFLMRLAAIDRHVEVRREALWPLAKGDDAEALATAWRWLADPVQAEVHDLCIRIAALKGRREALPRIRELARSPDEVIRVQALSALGDLADREGRPVVAEAMTAPGRIGATAKAALAKIDAAQSQPEAKP